MADKTDQQWAEDIDTFLHSHCTECDDHDWPHDSCNKCGVMRTQLLSLISEVRQAEREACAAIPDMWANSPSCKPNGPCDHIRQAAEIAQQIRSRQEAPRG